MATINVAQTGNFADTSTWTGGVVPTGTDFANLNTGGYTVTLNANLVETGLKIAVQGAGGSACTLVCGSYNLEIKEIVATQDGTINFGTGTHELYKSNAYGLDVANFDTANVIMGGCTIKHTSVKLRGQMSATGENTLNWGGGDDLNVRGSVAYGSSEGTYGDSGTWETDCSRVHFVVDMTGCSSPETVNWVHTYYAATSKVDEDGPYKWNWASVTVETPGQSVNIVQDDDDSEWAADNTIVWDVGAGGHGLTNEGDFKVLKGSVYMSDDETESKCVGLRVRDDMTVGDNSTTACAFYAGHTTNPGGLKSYIRVDGDLKLDGSAIGDTDAVFYAPNFEAVDDSDGNQMASYMLKGALIVFGTFTNEGVLFTFDSSSKRQLMVLGGITAGTWNIAVSGGDTSSGDGYDGLQNETGKFTYSEWQEIAIHEYHPSGISLTTKPDSGSANLRLMDLGGSTDSEFVFDANETFNDITVDANATLTIDAGVTVTCDGTFTNNGTLNENGTLAGLETKSHSAFGRGDGGKTSFQLEAAQDLDQPNWVENYFLDQSNRLG